MAVPGEGLPERLGPYRVRDRLGEGGMGVVYLATDPVLRLVAVKALRHGVTGETSRRRLTREFETMRLIHSPFVAEVIDANVEHEPPYIVTRYVPGRTVEDVVAQDGPMTGRALLRLAGGLATAL
ncbi:MAG TPA: protein kinase, partial [Streptosporangiaceae bacterium]|nr:protein kinase [Streptosporangiaceae bacterium]